MLPAINLEAGERMIEQIHRHWLIFLMESVGFLVAAIAPPILLSILPRNVLGSIVQLGDVNGFVLLFAYSLWLLFLWIAFFIVFTDYYLDVLIITNRRAIVLDQVGLFNRAITSCFIEKIQDIETKVEGLIPTLFEFGSIRIRTAGADSKVLAMDNVSDPQEIKEIIFRLQHGEDAGVDSYKVEEKTL